VKNAALTKFPTKERWGEERSLDDVPDEGALGEECSSAKAWTLTPAKKIQSGGLKSARDRF
jgi:hypothetical protein